MVQLGEVAYVSLHLELVQCDASVRRGKDLLEHVSLMLGGSGVGNLETQLAVSWWAATSTYSCSRTWMV